MKVTIITVCHNSAETIEETIESVIGQSYRNIDYIVIDGASTDQTTTIIQKYRRHINTFISEPDTGIYDAMNKGLRHARGDVIGFLNSDDYYPSTKTIANIVEHFRAAENPQIIFGSVIFINPRINDTKKITRHYSVNWFRPWMLRFGWMPPHPATFIRKEVYDQVGEYSTDYKISADYEMFVRLLLLKKIPYLPINKLLVCMRSGGISNVTLKNRILVNQEIVKACRDNGVYTNLFIVLLKIPIKLFELVRKPKGVKL